MNNNKRINPYPIHSPASTTSTLLEYPNLFFGKPFYCWDIEFLGNRDCCFNHLISLPTKDGQPKPLFPYEKSVYDAWNNHLHLWIKKATGLGISEFFLRLMLWLCLKDNQYQDCQMCIVTGPNIDLAKKLIERMKNMLIDYPSFKFGKMTDYILEVNKCSIQAYPSNNLGSFRSLTTPKFILLDEADFFRIGEQEEVRHVSERYIAKSNPHIVMVSTPNNPGGLFEQIENEPPDQCLYHRMFLDYRLGLGTIYSISDIDMAKQSPSFEREYDLKFGFGFGNVFLHDEIEKCCSLFKEVKINHNCVISCGIDPGFGSSKFGITILQLEDNILRVMYAKEFDRASYEQMLFEVSRLKTIYRPGKIYVDGAKPDFIKSLKSMFNEAIDYDKQIQRAKHDKIDYQKRMFVIPISFNEHGRELLGRFQQFVSKGWFALSNIEHKELVTQMRMARYKENGNLEKDETSTNTYDSFDATRLALKMYYSGART